MSQDPFAQFERSRGGWLIPVTLFVLGAITTTWAVNSLARLNENQTQLIERLRATKRVEDAVKAEPTMEVSETDKTDQDEVQL